MKHDANDIERYHCFTKPQYLRDLAVYQERAIALCEIKAVCKGKGEAIEIHHRKGRLGPLLNDTRYFVGCCRACHDYVERNRAWARKHGFLESRS